MPAERRVAFIRAVMIGREGLGRDVLLDLFRVAGANEPRNHLTTGNVSFTAAGRDVAPIVRRVEAGITDVVGRDTVVFVRALDHLRRLIDTDPFASAPPGDWNEREVVFLPASVRVPELPIESRTGRVTVFGSNGTELFAVGARESPGGIVERALGARVTVRAWSTLATIVAAHDGRSRNA